MSNFSLRTSTILPLPSSPHWAPRITAEVFAEGLLLVCVKGEPVACREEVRRPSARAHTQFYTAALGCSARDDNQRGLAHFVTISLDCSWWRARRHGPLRCRRLGITALRSALSGRHVSH